MEKIRNYFERLLLDTRTGFHRYLYDQINWEGRLIGLVGPRGVGKTTLVLQHIKAHLDKKTTLYVTADDLYFTDHRLIDLADTFTREGGTHLFIDEIHKYKDWSRELKLIYDYHARLQVVFTGSSILDIYKGASDLSRRAVMYQMQGLSFREYLHLFHQIALPAYSLEEILRSEIELPADFRPYAYFSGYLRQGYYPFSLEVDYEARLRQVINLTLETDIPQYAGMNVSTARKLKQLLSVVAQSVPFKPNMTTIATTLGVSRNSVADSLLYLEEAGIIGQLRDATGGVRGVGKVDKVYLDNTNLAYALGGENADTGNLRETFFYNQMRVGHPIVSSKQTDFEIGERAFEIGGKNKRQGQLKEVSEGYVVKDDIEFGHRNVLPLWLFGMIY
jgi:predicted AAA+ superfamily ATPase